MNIKRTKYLIANLLTNTSSIQERAELARWMSSEDAEATSRDAWRDALKDIDDSLRYGIWDAVRLSMKETIGQAVPTRRITVRKTYFISKIAAAVAIILCSTFSAYLFYSEYKESGVNNIYTFEMEPGQKGSLRLADGTVVHLNSASKITFSGDYNVEKRLVNLEGEAYFEVAKNPDKKFIVACCGVDVEALGTEFNVKAYSTDSLITTTLAKGKVKVSSQEQSVTLLPNDVATYNLKRQSIESSIVDDISIANYWRTGELVFRAEPFSSIAQTIERMYNVKIRIMDENLRNMRFTGTIQNNSFSNVFYVMSLSYPLTYTMTDSVITVSTQRATE